MLRVPALTLGELERAVLEVLWTEGPSNPNTVHAHVVEGRGISVNTVSSALKRLLGKGLLSRTKVSHAYVYQAEITRAELQRALLGAVAEQFDDGGPGLLAAFVDLAEARGEDTLRRLEAMIAARLDEDAT